jgi:hypothetical protein
VALLASSLLALAAAGFSWWLPEGEGLLHPTPNAT